MVAETEFAWAAGFIEADGCIHLDAGRNTKASVIVVQKDRRPLDRLQRIFSDTSRIGIVTRRGGSATYYRLVFSGHRAEEVLSKVLPYLDHKREMARLGIQLCERIRAFGAPGGHGKKLPTAELAQRVRLVQSARALAFDAERLSEAAPLERVNG